MGVPESCWEGEYGVSVGRGGQTCGEKQADRKEISCSFHAGRGDSSGPERCPDTRNTQSQKALPTSAPKSLPSNYHLRQTGPLLEPRTTWDQLVHDTEVPSSSDSGNVTKPTTESEQDLGTNWSLQRLRTGPWSPLRPRHTCWAGTGHLSVPCRVKGRKPQACSSLPGFHSALPNQPVLLLVSQSQESKVEGPEQTQFLHGCQFPLKISWGDVLF